MGLFCSVNRRALKMQMHCSQLESICWKCRGCCSSTSHAGNHKTLEIKVTGSLGKAHRFVCKILSSPRNRPRYNNENSLKTQKALRWKSKTFSASSREPEATSSYCCEGVAKGVQEDAACLQALACHLLSQAMAQCGRMSPNFLLLPGLSFKRTLNL